MLLFWRDRSVTNPGGVANVQDLADMVSAAIQGKIAKTNLIRRLTWQHTEDIESAANGGLFNVAFEKDELERFLHAKPGREHVMKVDRYHDDSVALVGDAAHGMYSCLGQGCACGLENCLVLAKCLDQYETILSSLEMYSALAVPQGHAITDLNLIAHVITNNWFAKLVATPLFVIQAKRGKMLLRRVGEPITYEEILKENKLLVTWARLFWKWQRLPFEYRTSRSTANERQ